MLGSAQNCHRPNVASFNGALTAAAVASRWKVNHGGTVGFYLGISWDVSFFFSFPSNLYTFFEEAIWQSHQYMIHVFFS